MNYSHCDSLARIVTFISRWGFCATDCISFRMCVAYTVWIPCSTSLPIISPYRAWKTVGKSTGHPSRMTLLQNPGIHVRARCRAQMSIIPAVPTGRRIKEESSEAHRALSLPLLWQRTLLKEGRKARTNTQRLSDFHTCPAFICVATPTHFTHTHRHVHTHACVHTHTCVIYVLRDYML